MRILYLQETPIIEIQEASENENDLYVDLGNMIFSYDREKKQLYQYQEWPKQKEIAEKQKAIQSMEDWDDKDKAIDELKKWIRENSKKVKYKVILDSKSTLVDKIESLIEWEKLSKEYL